MKLYYLILTCFFFNLSLVHNGSNTFALGCSDKPDSNVVLWNSKAGIERIIRSEYKTDFFQLAAYFQPQINPLYCGVATLAIILNAFRIPSGTAPNQNQLEVLKPEALGGDTIHFRSYSQLTLLNEETDRIKAREVINLKNSPTEKIEGKKVFDPGLSLSELKSLFEFYNLSVKLVYANRSPEKGFQEFNNIVKTILADSTHFIVVNFVGEEIGMTTGGHISPLAAYDEETNSVLILDVATHKNPWYWVTVKDLYSAMHTFNEVNYRGWLVIEE